MKNGDICPLCGEGHLIKKAEQDEITYKGRVKQVTDIYYSCDHCHVEQAGAQELKYNKRAMNEFKKEVDGLLTGKEVLDIRVKLGLTQDEAALVFGGGPNAFTKYENNDVIQSESMDKLLRIAETYPAVFADLCEKAAVSNRIQKTVFARVSFSSSWANEFAVETTILEKTH
ncbi:type II toxin-antitoxin system MqsA family antitoxin [Phytobacter diazotrophicus]|uniref:type II toxin-antitoxin system MqsA family antitoxin n=1 Tax=Phytobacter diazotrophicus TaxID=395631 RepID=UPI0013EDE59A|nr:type II toxin-antitoxin system MqsA family antitoxin [Phytobacter diazotrophicus]MDU6685331.1 type II toxin-antitoxin system MqsA family antitoxin [Enterobacteriaceae bacterium]QIH65055.1 type II toxin-antitoxin system MqsA family antitoxin [Enterobacteriaceae bacterium A-F18]